VGPSTPPDLNAKTELPASMIPATLSGSPDPKVEQESPVRLFPVRLSAVPDL
jgi:hypothetical protein